MDALVALGPEKGEFHLETNKEQILMLYSELNDR